MSLRVHLTSHPFQRIGAFALSALACSEQDGGYTHPERLSEEQLRAANGVMTTDLERTCALSDSKQPGGFWLGASYMLWPNCPINTSSRKKMSPAQLRENLRAWRDIPDQEASLQMECTLCTEQACGWYGKRDLPLAEATAYRNTSLHGGTPLCRGCLISLYALPYGCALGGGRATALHTWDDDYLAFSTYRQVALTRARALTDDLTGPQPGWKRQMDVIARLRAHASPPSEDLELLIFSNGNQDQVISTQRMDRPLVEWVHGLDDTKLRLLGRMQRTPKTAGRFHLAWALFERPDSLLTSVVRHLSESEGTPSYTPTLHHICTSYMTKVKHVPDRDLDQIRKLAGNIAATLTTRAEAGRFLRSRRRLNSFTGWLQRQAAEHTLNGTSSEPFVTQEQWLLLFESGDNSFFYREMLLIGVLEELHRAQPEWRNTDEEPVDVEDLIPTEETETL